jgi:N utilization substance protein A
MEVIVDDTQLPLAIGKRGQNVRLAARLLGWKIDIKSEEEKRQEVETSMSELIPAGTPISVLADYGLPEELIDSLVGAEVGTVEQLGSLTPEELEQLPGVGEESIQSLYNAINGFYAQFEAAAPEAAEAAAAESSEALTEVAESATEETEVVMTAAEPDAPAETAEEVAPEAEAESTDSDKP